MENNNPQTQDEISFMKKLYARLHTAKIGRKISALVLTAATALTISACTIGEHNQNNGADSGYTDKGEQRKYSELLEEVLTDPYYTQCISKAMNNPEYRQSAAFDSHPYAFLESQGYDVNAIMNGEQECRTVTYVLNEEPTNLYMYVKVTVGNAYESYLLKYELTKQEMKDYQTMHKFMIDGIYHCHSRAPFMNDKISELKTPEIVGTSIIKKSVMDKEVEDYPKHLKNHPSQRCEYIIINYDEIEGTFKLIMIPIITSRACEDSFIMDCDYKNYRYPAYEGNALSMGFNYHSIREKNSEKKITTQFDTQTYGFSSTVDLPEEYQQD